MEKRPGCHALNSTLPALGPEKALLAPTYDLASTFQRPGAELVKVPPNSSPLPPNQELGRPGGLRASVPSPPRLEGVRRGVANAPRRSCPSSPSENRAPFPPQPDTHWPVPQPPQQCPHVPPQPLFRAAPPPQLPTPAGSGAREGITSVTSQPLSATRGR